MNFGSFSTSRRLHWWALLTRALLWLVLGAWALFALTWVLLHEVLVPRLEDYRPNLEALASRHLGVQVRIARIEATSSGPIPTVTLHDVRLHTAQGQEALQLPKVQTALSVQSLWRLGFEQLLIEAPQLTVRRTRDGRVEVAGIDVSLQSDHRSHPLADWFFSQTEFAIRHGQVRWIDELRPNTPALTLTDLDLVVRNPGRQHLLRVDATPPPEWGDRFSVRGRFRQPLWQTDAGRWRDWTGTLYAELPRIDMQHLHRHVNTPADWVGSVQAGQGHLRLWADIQRAQVQGLTADLGLKQVRVKWQTLPEPLGLQSLSGRFDFQQQDRTQRFSTEQLAFETDSGHRWPGGNVRYSQRLNGQGRWAELDLQADQLDLQAVQHLATHVPLPEPAHQWLHTLQPSGRIEHLAMNWQAGNDSPQPLQGGHWRMQGQLRNLSLQAAAASPSPAAGHTALGRPGVSGAAVKFEATEQGGQAQVELAQGTLTFPGLFEDPTLRFERLSTDMRWTLRGEHIELELPRLRFANADATGEGQVRWRTSDPARSPSGSRWPGVLDLQATLTQANGAQVHRYLPQDIPADVRHYVRDAVSEGRAENARFSIKGDLWDFPFPQAGQGEFEVRAQLRDVKFAYMPPALTTPGTLPWPTLERMDAQLHINRSALHIVQGSGRVVGSPLLQAQQAEAHIADFMADHPRLQVQAQVKGPASDALLFVNRSPLSAMTSEALSQARMNGPADVRFNLDVPLSRPEDTRVQGQVRLAGNEVRLTPDTPKLDNVVGVVHFSERGFNVGQARARTLGGELRFSGGMDERASAPTIRFQGNGSVSGEGLRQASELEWLAPLAARASGSTPYQIKLDFTPQGTAVLVESTLQGLALQWPAPLNKTAAQSLPLRYEIAPQASAQPQRDWLSLDLGPAQAPLVSARYERRHNGPKTDVLRGAIGLLSPRPDLPEQGTVARAMLGDVDLQAWADALPASTPVPATSSAAEGTGSRAYWPTTIALQADRLRHDGRSFHRVVAGGTREQDRWKLNVQADELNGYVEYRPGQGSDSGKVYARLARLTLPPSTASEVETLLQDTTQQLPALDVLIQQFELNHRALGRLEMEAQLRPAPESSRSGPREWQLNKLNLSTPEARLQASGVWSGQPRRTALRLRLDIDDAGTLLGRFGMPGVVKGGKGLLEGQLGWQGSPMDLHYPSLEGTLQLDVQKGQFLKADPGLARLLGVLSLQSLPRRLLLDFRDVFSEGFAFDSVQGQAHIKQGVASTRNLQMKGVSAAVLIEGSTDLARETQDLQAVVIPELNAGTVSLLATVVNPVTGIGSFLAQLLLRQPLQAATSQQFHITGTWDEPKVDKITRRPLPSETPTPAEAATAP